MKRKGIAGIIVSGLIAVVVYIGNNAGSFIPPDGADVVGQSTVIDGDTIKIADYKIRLEGIDAPELKQFCMRQNFSYSCGEAAKAALVAFIDHSIIQCAITGKDRYKRLLGHCWKDDINLNAWMVRNGYALAYTQYSNRYIFEEYFAQSNNAGFHNGTFEYPWDWRKKQH